jgi:hypothetical protein
MKSLVAGQHQLAWCDLNWASVVSFCRGIWQHPTDTEWYYKHSWSSLHEENMAESSTDQRPSWMKGLVARQHQLVWFGLIWASVVPFCGGIWQHTTDTTWYQKLSWSSLHEKKMDVSSGDHTIRGHRGRDRMVVGFTTTYAISAYHH